MSLIVNGVDIMSWKPTMAKSEQIQRINPLLNNIEPRSIGKSNNELALIARAIEYQNSP